MLGETAERIVLLQTKHQHIHFAKANRKKWGKQKLYRERKWNEKKIIEIVLYCAQNFVKIISSDGKIEQ